MSSEDYESDSPQLSEAKAIAGVLGITTLGLTAIFSFAHWGPGILEQIPDAYLAGAIAVFVIAAIYALVFGDGVVEGFGAIVVFSAGLAFAFTIAGYVSRTLTPILEARLPDLTPVEWALVAAVFGLALLAIAFSDHLCRGGERDAA